MIEKNRDILSNALKNMPNRSPKPSNWDHISDNLDQLETESFISKHKNELPHYKAPENAWRGISKGLTPSFSAFMSSGPGKLILAIILLGGLVGAFLIYTAPSSKEIKDPVRDPNPVKTYQTNSVTEQKHPSDPDEPVLGSDQTTSERVSDPAEPNQAALTAKSDPKSTQEENRPLHFAINGNSHNKAHNAEKGTSSTSNIHSEIGLLELTSIPPKQILVSSENTERVLLHKSSRDNSGRGNYLEDFSKPGFSLGLYYSYNQFQKIEYEGMNIPHHLSSFGFELAYEKRNWFIKIGLGYLNWNEEGNYVFDYNQNKMVYQYNYVDSVLVSPENGEINYYTSKVEVFDSVPQQKTDLVTYNYKSLQIPVLIGYTFIARSKFKVALIGGVAFDFKISGKQYVPEFIEEDASITHINNSLIYRTKTNWRLIFGLNIDYRIAEGWSLFVEPTYQQYMTPIYTPNSIKGGGMLNIKAGIKYSF